MKLKQFNCLLHLFFNVHDHLVYIVYNMFEQYFWLKTNKFGVNNMIE